MSEENKNRYYTSILNSPEFSGVRWYCDTSPIGRFANSHGHEEQASATEESCIRNPKARPITYAEARAILGDEWPATWPQSGEGAVESTTAPATGNAVAGALSGAPSPNAARHTPEPWHISGDGDGMMIVQTSHITRDVWTIPRVPEDMRRIVACVNACAGMADPAATIRELREKVRVLEQLSRDLHFAYTNKDGDAPHGFEEQALADYARLIATATDADPVCREMGKANG